MTNRKRKALIIGGIVLFLLTIGILIYSQTLVTEKISNLNTSLKFCYLEAGICERELADAENYAKLVEEDSDKDAEYWKWVHKREVAALYNVMKSIEEQKTGKDCKEELDKYKYSFYMTRAQYKKLARIVDGEEPEVE